MPAAATFAPDSIDCDVHCAPARIEDLFPHLSGYWRQYITEAGIRLTGLAHAYPAGAPTTASAAARGEPGPAVPSTYEALARRYLDHARPRNAVLHCLTGLEAHRNPYYAAAIAAAVNDWVKFEFLDRDERLRAALAVSTAAPDDAVAEIERVGDDPRFVHVLLPVRSDLPWGHKSNHAIFAAARERSLHIGLHAWGRAGHAATPSGFTTTYLEDYVGNQPIAQAQVLSLVSEGVFERYPDLRVMLIECGFAWLPPLLWRFDKDWKGVWREVPWVKGPPSEYVRRHLRLTTAPAHLPPDPGTTERLLEMLGGVDMLAYSTDYPHDHGNGVSELLGRLDDDGCDALLRGNAAAMYRL